MAWKLAMARRHDPEWEQGWRELLLPHVRWPMIELPDVPLLISPKMRRAEAPEPPSSEPDPSDADPSKSIDEPLVVDPEPKLIDEPLVVDPEHHAPSRKPSTYFMAAGRPRPARASPKRCNRCRCGSGIVTTSTKWKEALDGVADWYGDHQ